MSDADARAQFLADLARMVDAEPEALQRHEGALSSSEDATEAIARGRAAAALISTCGYDFRPDPQLGTQLDKVLPDRPQMQAASIAPVAQGSDPEDAQVIDHDHDNDDEDDDLDPRAPRLSDIPAARRFEKPKVEDAPVASAGGGNRTKLLIGVGAVVVLGAAAALVMKPAPPPPPPPQPVSKAPPPPKNRLSLKLLASRTSGGGGQIHRTGAAGKPGPLLDADGKAAPGQGVSTAPRVRALLSFGADGRLVAAGGTRIVVDPEHDGQLALLAGRALVDVHSPKGKRVTLTTPAGDLAMTDALLHVRVGDPHVDLEVLRGSVIPLDAKDSPVTAGQHGRLDKGKPPVVATLWASSHGLDLAGFTGGAATPTPPGIPELTWTLEPKEPDPAAAQDDRDGGVVDAGPEPPELPTLTGHEVAIEVQGHTAITAVTHTFSAPSRDGVARYRLALPPGATWTGASVEVEGEMRAARPGKLPKDAKGALLAATADAVGLLRIDRLALVAEQPLRVRIEYMQLTTPTIDGRRHVLPLPHAEDTEPHPFKLTARATGGRSLQAWPYAATFDPAQGLHFADDAFDPNGAFTIDITGDMGGTEVQDGELHVWAHTDPGAGSSASVGHAAFALRPALPASKDATDARAPLLVFVDTSQSMADTALDRANAVLATLLQSLHPDHPVELWGCDRTCRNDPDAPPTAGQLRAQGAAQWITRRGAAGASNLDAALAHARSRTAEVTKAAKDGIKPRVLYLGDGLPTLGELDTEVLATRAQKMATADGTTLITVAMGSEAGAQRLRAIAHAAGGHHIRVSTPGGAPDAALDVLLALVRPRLSGLEVTLPEGTAAEPVTGLPPIADGRELTLLVPLPQRAVSGEFTIRGHVADRPFRRTYEVQFEATPGDERAFVSTLAASGTPDASLAHVGPGPVIPAVRILGNALAGRLSRAPGERGDPMHSVIDAPRLKAEQLEQELTSLWERAPMPETAPVVTGPRTKRRSWLVEYTGNYADLLRSVDRTRAAAEAEGGGDPERDLHARALTRLGNLERLRAYVEAWRRDVPDSPLAILHMAEVLMQEGQPDEALRMLEGIVDVRPADAGVHVRLARAYRRSGRNSDACTHLQTAGALRGDAKLYLQALQCLDDTAQAAVAERVRSAIGGTPVGAQVVALESKAKQAAEEGGRTAEKGDDDDGNHVRIEATWKPKQDLDLRIVTSEGQTLSWIGGRDDLEVAGARSESGERMDFDAAPGIYQISIHRRGAEDGDEIDGELDVHLPDGRQRMDFSVTGVRESIARIVIKPR